MCGLIGIVSQRDPVEMSALAAALEALRHRGPDDYGIWYADDFSVGLAHTRLSIIDPATGRQPILSEDGKTVLIVNGEFYDWRSQRESLEQRGHRFRTNSDSEVALHLYEEHGLSFLDHLRGEFALILWDQHQRRLIAARDRFGVKPLCYAETSQGLMLGSEAKALFAMGYPRSWNREALFQAMHYQYLPTDRTLFSGIRQLEPGHSLVWEKGRTTKWRYWDLDYPETENRIDPDEYSARIRTAHALDRAVGWRLQADVPVCFHLSGGLDSSSIVASAAESGYSPLACFTVAFDRPPYDELAQARETAAHVDAELHVVEATPTNMFEVFSDAVYFSEGLAINGHLPAKYLLSRAIRDAGFKVVLSGEGADEVFAGYPHLRDDYLLDSDGSSPPDFLTRLYESNAIMAGIQLPRGDGLPTTAASKRLGFTPCFLRAKASYGFRMRSILSEAFLAEFSPRDPLERLLADIDLSQLRDRPRIDQSIYIWTKLTLANYILRTLGDGTEMAHSVEGRVPFLDHILFEYIRRLPTSFKIRAGIEKYILREAVKPIVTDAVYRRQKQPFTAPPWTLPKGNEFGVFLSDAVRSTLFASIPFFDRRRTIDVLDRMSNLGSEERQAFDPIWMTLASVIFAHDRFGL